MSLISDKIESLDRFQSFIVFEPASVRVSDQDIFVIGKDVQTVFDRVYEQVALREDDMKMKILNHQMQKLANMLELINDYDNIIITKFFDRIWRRYSYITHLGESFINLKALLSILPEYDHQHDLLIAHRVDTAEEEFIDSQEEEENSDHIEGSENSSGAAVS